MNWPNFCRHIDCDCPTRLDADRDAQYDRDPEPDDRPWVLPEWMGGTEEAEDRDRALDDAYDASCEWKEGE